MTINSGPFNLYPGNSQEMIIALVGGSSPSDHLQSVSIMRDNIIEVRNLFNSIYPYSAITSISKSEHKQPNAFNLQQNYPNPFNPTTQINYQLAKNSKVSIKIYDVSGREVKTLVNETQAAGNHTSNFNGAGLASGFYFYRIEAGNFNQTKKMVILK